MFQEYKEKYCDSPYWEEAFNVAYEVKNQDLSPKEMCVVSFLKAIEYIKSKHLDEEELDNYANEYDANIAHFIDSDKGITLNYRIKEAYKAGYRKAKEDK